MDLYELLGIGREASLIEIKRSYRRLARKFHPDINPGDRAAEARFKEITQAYETLSDPERRLRYDAGVLSSMTGSVSFEFEGFDFSASHSRGDTTFGDLFAEIFARQENRAAGQERGADLHHAVTLSFDEALQGARRDVTVTRRDTCRVCRGAGVLNVTESRCTRCQGTGVLRSRRGSMVFAKSCEHCGGVGRRAQITCGTCAGLGVEMRSEAIGVRIPAGVSDGSRIRVPDKGHAGVRGSRAGDLYITVHVEAHDAFRREGDDLHTVIAIGVHEAALGAKVAVEAPDGEARVRVPPGTQTGQRLRVRGRGAPSPRTGERGDLVVEVKIMLPKILDERSKELLREFGRINSGPRPSTAGQAAPGNGDGRE
jgi:molecular chaperone DnaJ